MEKHDEELIRSLIDRDVELREHYVCTWCEMLDGRLILVPSQQSKRRAQQVRYPAEATIVGRVTGITQDIVQVSVHEVRA